MPVITIQPSSQDTYVSEAEKTSIFGAEPYLYLRNTTDGNRIVYVEFDLSLFESRTILSAALHLKVIEENQPGPPHPDSIDIKRCTSDWNEATLDWSPQPYVSDEVMGTSGWLSGLGWKEWALDPTELMLMVVTNYGMRVKCEPEDQGGNDWLRFASKENGTEADRPKLVVQYVGVGAQVIWMM